MATTTIRATEVISKENYNILVPFAIKMARSCPKKSCENDVYGVVLQLEFGILSNQYTFVLFPCFVYNLQVPDTGNYIFYVSCDDWCELWKYNVDEYGIEKRNKKAEKSLTKRPIIAVYAWTGHLEWNK